MSSRCGIAAVAVALLIGCEGMGPQKSVRLRTDSSAYTLQHTASALWEVVIPVEITNLREETVYLVRYGCGARAVARPGGQHLSLIAPGQICYAASDVLDDRPEPVAIARGETLVESVPLVGSLNSMGSSTMEDLTGPVFLWVAIGPESWQIGEQVPALLPEEERRTNVFRIDPPVD